MRARLVVFPIKGRNWCFSRSIDPSAAESTAANTPSTVKELWKKISSDSKPLNAKAELLVDFVANKFKCKACSSKITTDSLDVIVLPPFLFASLIRWRLEVSLLPLTTPFSALPLPPPNIPFFWVLFRTYSHWRAFQGSVKLLQLVSDHSQAQNSIVSNGKSNESGQNKSKYGTKEPQGLQWVLEPSKKLEHIVRRGVETGSLSEHATSDICMTFSLNKTDVLKYRDVV
ncbi:hypothetical protein QUC31_012491 [Theobroma cacao]